MTTEPHDSSSVDGVLETILRTWHGISTNHPDRWERCRMQLCRQARQALSQVPPATHPNACRCGYCRADKQQLMFEAERLHAQVAELQRQVDGRVTIAEEIQRRHDAVASLSADLEHTRQIVADVRLTIDDMLWGRTCQSLQGSARIEASKLLSRLDAADVLAEVKHQPS